MPEFRRGMLTAFNSIKDGKKHTLKSLRAAFAKDKIKKGVIGRLYRLGRLGRELKQFDVVIDLGESGEMSESATFQLIKGAQAKKSFAEKKERYGSLAESRAEHEKSKSKKSKSKAKAKPTKKAAQSSKPKSKPKSKPAKKTVHAKKAPVAAGHASEEGSSDNEVLES